MPAAQARNSVQNVLALDVATERAPLENSEQLSSNLVAFSQRYGFWSCLCFTFEICLSQDPANTLGDHFS